MTKHAYNDAATLAESQQVSWPVHDLIGGDMPLDFTKPFLPESLAQVHCLSTLSAHEKRLLNQIRGYTYLSLFALVEECILPFVADDARKTVPGGDLAEPQAMTSLAVQQEAKHIHLFRRFCEEFEAHFPTRCEVSANAADYAKAFLARSRLGVALLSLHLAWMTQVHYVDSLEAKQDLDPQFKSLLHHHWMEQAQHAKLQSLLVDKLARDGGWEAIREAFADFDAIGTASNALLAQQALLDVDSLERAAGRTVSESERSEIWSVQSRAYRYTFIASGLVTKDFLLTADQLVPGVSEKMLESAAELVG
jgi:hypothetical protein